MSLDKAKPLLRLAELAASRHGGVSLPQLAEKFAVDHRTAWWKTRALEDTFDQVEILVGEVRRLLRLQGLRDSKLVAREGDGLRHFRLDRMQSALLKPEVFQCDPGFDLVAHATRAVGSFHSEAEQPEVVRRFTPDAASTVAEVICLPGRRRGHRRCRGNVT